MARTVAYATSPEPPKPRKTKTGRAPRRRPDAPGINDTGHRALEPSRPGGGVIEKLTEEQHAERRNFVEALVLSGMPNTRVVQVCARPYSRDAGGNLAGLGIGPSVVVDIIRQIRQRWADDYKSRESTRRTDQLTRLHNDLALMSIDKTPNRAAKVSTEKLIAEIEGNLAPRRLEVAHSALPDALVASVSDMTEADVEAALLEELEREKKLKAIDTTAEALPPP